MNAAVLASPTPLPTAALPVAVPHVNAAAAAGLTMTAANCVAITTALLQAACQRGQLEDASAAARIALPFAPGGSPQAAMLQVLSAARPVLMQAPEEDRLYLLRTRDGSALGLLRLRDSGLVSTADGQAATHWALTEGNLELSSGHQRAHARFMLCGEQGGTHTGKRLYLGEAVADGSPLLLQELNCTYTRLRMMDPELANAFCGLYDADAMVPAELPDRAVMLLTAPHNGADALTAALQQAGVIHLDGELMHPRAIGLADAHLGADEAAALHGLRTREPAWFARMMLGRSHDSEGRHLADVPVRGFTLSAMHSPPVMDWALADVNLRVVHVVRSNLLAEFADLLAEQSGVDSSTPLHFEAERFTRFVAMKQHYLAALRAKLVQRNADTVEVDASRLNPATMAELRAFLLDEPVPADSLEDGVVLSISPVIERFDNPVAVAACLAALGQADWAGLEGSSVTLTD